MVHEHPRLAIAALCIGLSFATAQHTGVIVGAQDKIQTRDVSKPQVQIAPMTTREGERERERDHRKEGSKAGEKEGLQGEVGSGKKLSPEITADDRTSLLKCRMARGSEIEHGAAECQPALTATEAADELIEGALQRAIPSFAGLLDSLVTHCDDNFDVFDGYTNFMMSPKARPLLSPSLDSYRKSCGKKRVAHAKHLLAHASSAKELGETMDEIFYLRSFLGYERQPLQYEVMDACRKVVSLLGKQGDAVLASREFLSDIYNTDLFRHGNDHRHFSWLSEDADDRIEEFEDLLIWLFDRTVAGLNLTDCFRSANWSLPDIYNDFIATLGESLRPYPDPKEMDDDVLERASYFVTHLIYFFSGFGLGAFSDTASLELEPERRFLKSALPLLSRIKEVDITSEVVYCLFLLGENDSDALMQQKRLEIVAAQREDGLWGSEDVTHATYNAITALMSRKWFSRDASFHNLSMISADAYDELLSQARLLV